MLRTVSTNTVKEQLTAERLRELVIYDPETGIFTRRAKRRHLKAGARLGCRPNAGGYFQIRLEGPLYYAHRLAWLYVNGDWPSRKIDHRDGDRANNRITNLRLATDKQNCQNARLRKSSKTGLKGVYFQGVVAARPYAAAIQTGIGKRYLGCFATPEEAHAAYAAAARLHFGEFARAA